MPKYTDIADTISARVRHGDYRLRGFPSHAGLVDELGVNARTVSKALSRLVNEGLLVRHESGRIDVRDEAAAEVLHIGVLSPAWPSENIMKWHHLIHQASQDRRWIFKPVVYSHWHDAAITETLRGMDAVFFISIGDDFPPHVLEQIKTAQTPVVVLEQDISAEEIPCLRYWNPSPINKLIDHLRERGYRRVACLNTQPHSNVIRERIATWRLWSSAQGMQGELIDEPVALYESAAAAARRIMVDRVSGESFAADAVVCTTREVAVGAVRGIIDGGGRPGADIGVCSVEDWTGLSRLLSPSLTCLEPPSMSPLLQACLDYFEQEDRSWLGPFLIQPSSMNLFVGETTVGPSRTPSDRSN